MNNQYTIKKTALKKGLPDGAWVCFNKEIDEFQQIFANSPTQALINYIRWEQNKSNSTQMLCLECGKMVEVGDLEMRGVLNVFCTDGDCEDKFAFKQ